MSVVKILLVLSLFVVRCQLVAQDNDVIYLIFDKSDTSQSYIYPRNSNPIRCVNLIDSVPKNRSFRYEFSSLRARDSVSVKYTLVFDVVGSGRIFTSLNKESLIRKEAELSALISNLGGDLKDCKYHYEKAKELLAELITQRDVNKTEMCISNMTGSFFLISNIKTQKKIVDFIQRLKMSLIYVLDPIDPVNFYGYQVKLIQLTPVEAKKEY